MCAIRREQHKVDDSDPVVRVDTCRNPVQRHCAQKGFSGSAIAHLDARPS